MTLDLYMNHHVRRAVTVGLRQRGVDVLPSQEDGTNRLSDPELLNRALAVGRTLFSQDEDLLAEATRRQRSGEPFAGVIYGHQRKVTIGQCITDLEIIAKVCEPADLANRVFYLPL
jgi:hypothetical protein